MVAWTSQTALGHLRACSEQDPEGEGGHRNVRALGIFKHAGRKLDSAYNWGCRLEPFDVDIKEK